MQESISLAGQTAVIARKGKRDFKVTFAADVRLAYESGEVLHAPPPTKPAEISGNVKLGNGEDFSGIKDTQLILSDQRVFTITFYSPSYFSVVEPVSSRTRLDF